MNKSIEICEPGDIQELAESVVSSQVGQTVSDILNSYGDRKVTYEGDSIWLVDGTIICGEYDIVQVMAEMITDLDDSLQSMIARNYAADSDRG